MSRKVGNLPRINEATDTDLKVIEESGERDGKLGKENKSAPLIF